MTVPHYGSAEWKDSRARRLTALAERGRYDESRRHAERTVDIALGFACGIDELDLPDGTCIEYVQTCDTYNETLVAYTESGPWAWSSWGDEYESAEQRVREGLAERIRDEHYDDIVAGAARGLWLSAYADAVERKEETGGAPAEHDQYKPGPGEDWDDYAPETPDVATSAAWTLLRKVGDLNFDPFERLDVTVARLCACWIEAQHETIVEALDAVEWADDLAERCERFGFVVAMASLGHGVGPDDDVKPCSAYRRPDLPFIEATTDFPDPIGGFWTSGL